MFKGLRGRLTLTYTLVTVLALMALEFILFIVLAANYTIYDQDGYLNDVVYTLVPEARAYLQPEQDLPGLQVWLETLARTGKASLEPQDPFDSPAARIVPDSPLYVLSPQREILAQIRPAEEGPFTSHSNEIIEKALAGKESISDLHMVDENGNYWVAIPIFQEDHDKPVLGILVLTVEPVPGMSIKELFDSISAAMLAGLVMLAALAPFGAIFGYIISKKLTGRLQNLSFVAQAWGNGDFAIMPPPDRRKDEISALSQQMREMALRIHSQWQDLQVLTQMRERNRLAQELHDTVKQQTFATLMQVRAARNRLHTDVDSTEKSLIEAENLIKASQQELASMIAELRPPSFEGKGFTRALHEFVDNWSNLSCIPASFKVNGEKIISEEAEHTLYRIAQEGLSNVSRHSRASAAVVDLCYDDNEVRLEIRDNGIGFDISQYQSSGFGLTSMQERLKDLGGRLEIRTGKDSGTTLTAALPIASAPALEKRGANG